MKLNKEVIDKLLKDTDSEPQDLLNWFKGLKKKNGRLPCFEKPYLGKHRFTSDRGSDSTSTISVNGAIDEEDKSCYPTIYSFYDYCFDDRNYKNRAIRTFKKLYNLK